FQNNELPVPVQVGFDYSTCSAEVAEFAQRVVAKVRDHQRHLVADVIDIGNDLIKVKSELGHGNFSGWLQVEFGWTDRTARNYMAVADRFSAKTEIVSVLPLRTVYLLAAESTPTATRDDIVHRLGGGEALSVAAINEMIGDARAHDRQRKAEAKLSRSA